MELHAYKYKATTRMGKTIQGKVESINRQSAMRMLESKGYKGISLIEVKRLWHQLDNVVIGQVFNQRHLIFFLRQLGSLLKSGVKLNIALELLALQQDNRQIRKIYFEIYYYVTNGYAFSKALSQRNKEFPSLLLQMVEVGEVSGDLANTLVDMADYYENQMRISTEIKGAIRMPLIYLIATRVIAVGMLMFVFPNITGIYESFENATIPPITQFFLDTGVFFEQNTVWILMGFSIIVISLFGFYKYTKIGRRYLSVLWLKMPVVGQLTQMNNQIMIANALSQMLSNGIHSMKALTLLRRHTTNIVYQNLIEKVIKYIEEGHPFFRAFEESDYIDPIMAKMIQTGEQSGDIPNVMKNLSDYYNGITDLRITQLKNAIQPILLVLVYGLVGFMILAIMLPMLSLGSQI